MTRHGTKNAGLESKINSSFCNFSKFFGNNKTEHMKHKTHFMKPYGMKCTNNRMHKLP